MAITQTPAGWTFVLGRETFGPYPTRDRACEALYDAERGKAPEQIITWVVYALDEREAGARLEAMLVEQERKRHGTLIDSA